MVRALIVCVALAAAGTTVAAPATGRHWELAIEGIACASAGADLSISARVRYLGPNGAAEAPVVQLVDGKGRAHAPKSMAWTAGGKALAAWLSAGGVRIANSGDASTLRYRFDVRDATEALKLEFGDIAAFPISRDGKGVCEAMLKPAEIRVPRAAARTDGPIPKFRVHRESYPCLPSKSVESPFPPYLPEQLLVFGRGYLPGIRQVDLPMGKAVAQSYSYAGADNLAAVEEAARRVIARDYPGLGTGIAAGKYFALNWGVQKAASGNELYSVGIYAFRPCPK